MAREPVDLTLIEDPDKQADEVFDVLTYCDLDGFSGRCSAAATAINEVLFHSQGTIVMAYNQPFMARHAAFIGHVAVKYRGRYWDSTGEIETDHLQSWGMLAPDDQDYADRFGDGWSEEIASLAAVKEMPDGIVIPSEYLPYYEDCKQRLTQALILKNDDDTGAGDTQ
jgi:hypothetical protein